MPKHAFVLMTAMPPTKGHLHLIQFASGLASTVNVIVATQPDEPYAAERITALREAAKALPGVIIHQIHKTLPQEPEGGGFWDMWADFLHMFGFRAGDYIVASEMYGAKLAQVVDGHFMPYDVDRELYSAKATFVREAPRTYFDWILPEFQPVVRQTITMFGAESTGKTTLSRTMAGLMSGHWAFEYARPYLEKVKNEVTDATMRDIWRGQLALQRHMQLLQDKPFIFQDTDLFSTVGYWDFWTGDTPTPLKVDAINNKSDLYIITQSNIPFEPDPLRYGGDKRESKDQFWIDLCEDYELNYVVLTSDNLADRVEETREIVRNHFDENVKLAYDRKGQ